MSHGLPEPKKVTTKAERRQLQEAQRAAKSAQSTTHATSNQNKENSKRPAPPSAAKAMPANHVTNAAVSVTTPNQMNSSLFMHLDHPGRLPAKAKAEKDVHPSIRRLALQWSELRIVGCNARSISMLTAFKNVINSYSTPNGMILSRHLPTHLSPQIEHLYKARSRSLTLGNAIRYVKWEIAQLPLELDDEEAKEWLCERIDHFIRDRIALAGKVIETNTLAKIRDGDTILTFARSSIVESTLLEAKRQGKTFSVVVVDSRPMLEGARLLQSLQQQDIPTTYALISSLGSLLSQIDIALLGAHALLSDGAIFSRAGTATVAMMCKQAGKPVVCLCETYKFSDRIMLDSITGNEMASPLPLMADSTQVRSDFEAEKVSSVVGINKPPFNTSSPHLSIFNLLYDVSRPEDCTVVISEAGLIQPASTSAVMSGFKPLA